MSGHTPGPWTMEWDEDDGFRIAMSNEAAVGASYHAHELIEYAPDIYSEDGEQYKEAEANARLIAAAPDLLDALRHLTDVVEGGHYDVADFNDAVREAWGAIAKATGEEVPA